jgi:Holliday junction resolvase
MKGSAMIKDIFQKPIDRNIEGVIKADNLKEEVIFQEVDEYVITRELNKMLDEFFAIYSGTIGKKTESIGVWISGFFGSGKSHLLKILSYILSNQQVNSRDIGEIFLRKIDEDDFELKANIQKALSIPAQTILFNIDQKSDIGSKSEDDAILSVFMKVFNEMRGYYPKQGYIAKFEKDLDSDGLLEKFKEAFEAANPKHENWEHARKKIHLIKPYITKALESIGVSADRTTIDDYKRDYKLSIEDFVEEVKEYINTQEKDFRLIFCVDEIGQYIGDNTKLMLNLQTIVEKLATRCQGSAWVIVTSQSAVSDLISSNEKMENDFSKILGRFKTALTLTSANATEVISKRLLEKKEAYIPQLEALYEQKKNAMQSILHFTEGSRKYRIFKNGEEFVSMYPFIPYQMDLFQSCITGLSSNSAFQGRHQSVGERSMLDVVQNVAKEVSKQDIGTLTTFDAFYDGLAGTIRGELQTQIKQAADTLPPFTTKVLKVLFMVKYVKEFNANLDNITTLLVDSLDVNIKTLKQQTKQALEDLVDQIYIQKVGERYEFLTDIEKEIENAIKETDIESREVSKKLADWIYDDLIKINKVRFEGNKQDYPFTRKMDDVIVKGKEEELMLNVITPLNSEAYDEERLIHKSMADRDVIVALPPSSEFEKDLELYVKTNKYIMHKRSNTITPQEEAILNSKSYDNNNIRNKKLQEDLKNLFSEAKIYFNGKILHITSSDVKNMIEAAFNEAINTIYTNLPMLSKIYTEHDIEAILTQSDDLFTGENDALNEAELDMLAYLKRQKQMHQNVTVSKLLEYYTSKPYGWYQNAILSIIASLYARKKIDLKDKIPLEKEEVRKVLTNSRRFATTRVDLAIEIDDSKMRTTKKQLQELFPAGKFLSPSPKEIYDEAMRQNSQLIEDLSNYTNLDYPFVESFKEALIPFQKLQKLGYENFFDSFDEYIDELLDTKEDLVLPILEFMKGEKRKIYDEVRNFLKDNSQNLKYIKDEKLEELQQFLKLDKPYLGNKVQQAKHALHHIESLLTPLVKQAREEAIAKLEKVIKKLQESENFTQVPEAERYKIIRPVQMIQQEIQSSGSIDSINVKVSYEKLKEYYLRGLDQIDLHLPKEASKPKVSFEQTIPKVKAILKTHEDIEAFVLNLKENLIKEIDDGKEVVV